MCPAVMLFFFLDKNGNIPRPKSELHEEKVVQKVCQ
jgi:hypothetical protein